MKTFTSNLIAMVTMSAVALASGFASACPGGGYGGGYSSYSSYRPSYVQKIYVEPEYTCFRPLHAFIFVLPGDTWASISQREYGSPRFFDRVAAFNGIGLSVQLAVGQQIRLPEIHPNGVLLPSSAPGLAPFALPGQGIPQGIGLAGTPTIGTPNFAAGNLGTPNGLPNGIANFAPNAQGSTLPQNFIGSANGLPTSGMQAGSLPNGGMPTNGMPTSGTPMSGAQFSGAPMNGSQFGGAPTSGSQFGGAPMTNGGSPLAQNGSPMMSQNFAGPMAGGSAPMNGSGAMNAAAPMNASAPLAPQSPQFNSGVPTANIRLASAQPSMLSAAAGSELVVDGQQLGIAAGFVRLRISGLTLKVEVLDWSEGSVKIRLPELDLSSAAKADLEVLRADGSLASKTALELTPAAAKLALGN